MQGHRVREAKPLNNPFHKMSMNDQVLSKINQVYFVTKQVPQQENIKPQLTFLPIIQKTGNTFKEKSAFMSSTLLSSVHSIDLDSLKVTRKYFNTVIAPKRKYSAKSAATSSSYLKGSKSFNSVICVPRIKSTDSLIIRNSKSIDLKPKSSSKLGMKIGSSSTPALRQRTAKEPPRRVQSQSNNYRSFESGQKDSKIQSKSEVDLSRKIDPNLTRSASNFMLASLDNFKSYHMTLKKLDRKN